jgi:hypothetical protein
MSSSLNNMDSQGYDSPSLRWVDTASDDGYKPTDDQSRSTASKKYAARYLTNSSALQYQTIVVSTSETRKRDKLMRLNKRLRTMFNAC